MRTKTEIQDDIYSYIQQTPLAQAVSGAIYTVARPTNSTTEDICIRVSATSFGQVQTAIVEVSVYIIDIIRGSDSVINIARERELARLAADALSSYQEGTWRIRMESQEVQQLESIRQHKIINTLYYQYCN